MKTPTQRKRHAESDPKGKAPMPSSPTPQATDIPSSYQDGQPGSSRNPGVMAETATTETVSMDVDDSTQEEDEAFDFVHPHARPHQNAAVVSTCDALTNGEGRVQVVAACGTGKTLMALWITERLVRQELGGTEHPEHPLAVLVVVPSLALASQLLIEWRRMQRWEELDLNLSVMAVCSDKTVGQSGQKKKRNAASNSDYIDDESDDDCDDMTPEEMRDQFKQQQLYDIDVTTDAEDVANFLLSKSQPGIRLCISTLQSVHSISNAQKIMYDQHTQSHSFVATLFDEAHNLAGRGALGKAALRDGEKGVSTDARVFFTATPRLILPKRRVNKHEEVLDVVSMDNRKLFGRVVYRLSFREAVTRGLVCPYKIVVATVGKRLSVDRLTASKVYTNLAGKQLKSYGAAQVVALSMAVENHNLRKVFTFHSRNSEASLMRELLKGGAIEEISEGRLPDNFRSYFVHGKMAVSTREDILRKFAKHERAVVSTARALQEGIDCPAADCVAFMSPKSSVVDIMQSACRCLRVSPGKDHGCILIPLLSDDAGNPPDVAGSPSVKHQSAAPHAFAPADAGPTQAPIDGSTAAAARPSQAHAAHAAGDLELSHVGSRSKRKKQRTEAATGGNGAQEQPTSAGQVAGIPSSSAQQKHPQANAPPTMPTAGNEAALGGTGKTAQEPNKHVSRRGRYERVLTVLRGMMASDTQLRGIITQLSRGDKAERAAAEADLWQLMEVECEIGMEEVTTKLIQRELVEAIVDELTDTFHRNYGLLKDYKAAEGHCDVPRKHEELGTWVHWQRTEKATGKLSDERVALLDAIGFSWVVRDTERQWEEHFNQLQKYKAEHNHCRVPQRYEPNPTLSKWVQHRRTEKRVGKLSPAWTKRLDSIGFEWEPQQDPNFLWLANLTTVNAYLREHNGEWPEGTSVYEKAKKKKQAEAAKAAKEQDLDRVKDLNDEVECLQRYLIMARWLNQQKVSLGKERRLIDQGASPNKADSVWKIAKLNALGFVWSQIDADFGNKYQQLLDHCNHCAENGDDDPLKSLGTVNKELNKWCNSRKDDYANGNLPQDRIGKLESIPGWRWSNPNVPWQRRVESLRVLKNKIGHCFFFRSWQRYGVEDGMKTWIINMRNPKRSGPVAETLTAVNDLVDHAFFLDRFGVNWWKTPKKFPASFLEHILQLEERAGFSPPEGRTMADEQRPPQPPPRGNDAAPSPPERESLDARAAALEAWRTWKSGYGALYNHLSNHKGKNLHLQVGSGGGLIECGCAHEKHCAFFSRAASGCFNAAMFPEWDPSTGDATADIFATNLGVIQKLASRMRHEEEH